MQTSLTKLVVEKLATELVIKARRHLAVREPEDDNNLSSPPHIDPKINKLYIINHPLLSRMSQVIYSPT